MSKHTSGPWLLADDGSAFVYALNESGEANRFNLSVSGGFIDKFPSPMRTTNDELLANARLIATAPELLEAVNWLKCTLLSALAGTCIRDADEVISFAEKAIAKATQE